MSKCPRCGEPDDGLFNRQTDKHGPFCASCGWPERLDLTVARQALSLGYRCEAHEGDAAGGRCVCCEVAQVASLTAENAALREALRLAMPLIAWGDEHTWSSEQREAIGLARALVNPQAPADSAEPPEWMPAEGGKEE
jgi:hypothetical protein